MAILSDSSVAKKPKRLLNHVVDERAKQTPDMAYAELPLSATDFGMGFRTVTYSGLANAVNGVAWWLSGTLGVGTEFRTLLYLGPNDLRHNILLLGAVKAGYKMLFTSPRYSTLAQVHLIKSVSCQTMLVPEARPPVTEEILAAYPLQVIKIPSIEDLFDRSYLHYPFGKTFDQARHEPLVVLHTSGSTGMPKPIVWTHDWAASFIEERRLLPPAGCESSDNLIFGKRILSLFPHFHAGHLFFSLLASISCSTTVIYPLSGVPPSVHSAADALKYTTVDTMTVTPPHIGEIGHDPDLLQYLSERVKTLFWAGGDVPTAMGDAISRKIRLFTTCGSTEMGMWPTLYPSGTWPADHWKYMHVHPSTKMDFRFRSDGLYEAYMVRAAEPEQEQPVFKVHTNLQEFSSGDLFTPHPSEPDLWQHYGRADDMVIFASGEKFHPASVEKHIAGHPEVEEVLLIGTRRPQAVLLLAMKESVPTSSEEERAEVIERLWPTVIESNATCPTFAKTTRELIVFIRPEKPLLRTAKGTMQRNATIHLYEEEVDQLFAEAVPSSTSIPMAESQ